jgi:hypothetical protein
VVTALADLHYVERVHNTYNDLPLTLPRGVVASGVDPR